MDRRDEIKEAISEKNKYTYRIFSVHLDKSVSEDTKQNYSTFDVSLSSCYRLAQFLNMYVKANPNKRITSVILMHDKMRVEAIKFFFEELANQKFVESPEEKLKMALAQKKPCYALNIVGMDEKTFFSRGVGSV